MKPSHALLATFVLLSLAMASATLADEREGVTSELFNGQNLEGWQVTGCDALARDGCLLLKGGNGFVRADHRYGDFVLEIDWRPLQADASDSGIYFRSDLPAKGKDWPARYQLNLQKGKEGGVGKVKDCTPKPELIKSGDWNHFKLSVIGHKAALEINGRPAWKTDAIEATSGYIGLQSEVPGGGQFEFRNIRVTEVGAKPLFNGKDLTGWEGGGGDAAACWKVEDGVLLCTGQRGPWLRTAKEYGDFNFRLEYKLTPAGNSGVYVRVPANGARHGEASSGNEVQILDDTAPRYAKLKDSQYCGSIYKVAAAKPHVGRPVGEWNSLEINCQGTHFRVTHNGVDVVDVTDKECPSLAKRNPIGYLGLQNHSSKIWFRNVRVAAPLP